MIVQSFSIEEKSYHIYGYLFFLVQNFIRMIKTAEGKCIFLFWPL